MSRLFNTNDQTVYRNLFTMHSAAIISAVVFISFISFIFLQTQDDLIQEKLQQNGINISTYPEFTNISLLFKVIRVLLGIY